MTETMHFRGVLPPGGRAFFPPPGERSPGGLILAALSPLRGELDDALARGDQARALRIAYAALSRTTDALAAMQGGRVPARQVRIHAILVQLTALPLELHLDGTLSEMGTQIDVSYRHWEVDRSEADIWARQLAERYESLWPGAWVVMSS